jgi:hypothetical protein
MNVYGLVQVEDVLTEANCCKGDEYVRSVIYELVEW